MPKSPAKSKKDPPASIPGQFSISSFLPKQFAVPSSASSLSSASTSASGSSTGKAKKRKAEANGVPSDGEDGQKEFKMPALPVRKKGKAVASGTSKGKAKEKKTEVLDLISDDEEEELVVKPSSSKKLKNVKGKTKAKPQVEEKPSSSLGTAATSDMWMEQYAPEDRDDLALHPRKLLDVQTWLCEAFALSLPDPSTSSSRKSSAPPKPPPPVNPKLAKYRRVLVLSGAAGSAKTAALKVLGDEMDVEIVEWTEGMRDEFGADDGPRESLVYRFSSFLARAGMSPALEFGDFEDSPDAPSTSSSRPSSSRAKPSSSSPPLNPNKRRLILLEDLPNVSHYPTKLALRSAIAQYLASPRVTCPLVVIISEALARPGTDDGVGVTLGGSGSRGDSYDARNVLGIEVLQHAACREIAFNPIASTIMKRALTRTLDRLYAPSSSSSRSRSCKSSSASSSRAPTVSGLDPSTRPSLSTLDLLIQHANGDIRSALMSLQFLATQGGGSATSLGLGAKREKKKSGKGKKRKRGGSSDESEEEEGKKGGKEKVKQLLQFVTSRESSLFVFHALGKVLYNKRWGDSADDDKKDLNRPGILQNREYDKLPKHLRKAGLGRNASKVDPDVLFAEAPLDPDIFLSYLHHNYPPFTEDIEECSGILDGLSSADAMMMPRGAGAGEGEDAYHRSTLTSNYAFHLATRTTLLSLPSPVPRRKQTLRKSELWETLRLSRQNEEGVSELLGLGASLGGGRLSGTAGLVYASSGGRKEGEAVGLVTRREGGSLMSEIVPWLGVIKPKDANPFLLDLATFPPLDLNQAVVTGDALGEKDLEDEDDNRTAPSASSPTGTQAGGGRKGRVLQEVEDEAVEQPESVDVGGDMARLFDEDDDIEE
ncbi:hypothetical protein JCM8547_000031 [Rhodosporidiobolus lusitaniae]